jgi:hexosaminidase
MQSSRFFLSVFLFATLQGSVFAQTPTPDAGRYPLIPWPSSLTPASGEVTIDAHTSLIVEAAPNRFSNELGYLRSMLRHYLGEGALRGGKTTVAGKSAVAAGTSTADARTGTVAAVTTSLIVQDDETLTAPESYRLSVGDKKIVLAAHTPAGLFYAIQTLRQLMPAALENGHGSRLEVPCVTIGDQPAWSWRGMMLDVSRHFFGTDYLRKFIDEMALYKYNKLHLHLTDDQGWRIEIKKYPLLTGVSGWRALNDQDSACLKLAKEQDNPDFEPDPAHLRRVDGKVQYGGFYTQEEMKAIIRYAASRHIEVIPEIDMPGHMMAAILLYPELTCDGKKGDDWRHGFSTPICPCKENTLAFAKEVFTEIADLFPSKYIHIGGDEVEKTDWKRSPLCGQFMQAHHLTSEDQLQSWFNDYMEAFFRSKGKTLLGWDEIVAGGIDSNAVVMYWRTWARQAPLQATRNGNKVIMSADGPLYFDAWPDRNSLSAVYHYNPVDPIYGMNATEQQNIIGVQGNLWSERVPTGHRADYLVMPRMTALAELGWTHRDAYDFYLRRLEHQYDRLDRLHIHYRLPDLTELSERRVFIDTASFFIAPPVPGLTIRYTDQGFPTLHSPVLTQPLRIDHSMELRVAAFTAAGRRGDVQTISFDRQDYAPAIAGGAAAAETGPTTAGTAGNTAGTTSTTAGGGAHTATPGLRVGLFRGEFQHTTNMAGRADSSFVAADVTLPIVHPDAYGLQFRGVIEVPATGIYSFFLTSDDGSRLTIADRPVIDNDGAHSSQERSGQVALAKGLHPFALDYMDLGGGGALELRYSVDNGQPQPVPSSWYRH